MSNLIQNAARQYIMCAFARERCLLPFLLYIRLGCHLCEDARRLLAQMQIPHEVLNIDDDEALRQQYHCLVPVFQHRFSERELIYPFDQEALLLFIQQVHHHE